MWACLSANITIHNVVIGIINEPRKLQLRDILEFTLFSFISILAYTSVNVASGIIIIINALHCSGFEINNFPLVRD